MRIVSLPAHYGYGAFASSQVESGIGRNFRTQAMALARAGHDVLLIYLHFDGQQGREVLDTRDEGVRCLYIHARPVRLPINVGYRVSITLRVAAAMPAHDRPDVIHAHGHRAALWAVPLALMWNVPYVITEHGPVRYRPIRGLWRRVAVLGFRRASRVIAVSAGQAEALRAYTENTVVVVPNMVRSDFLEASIGDARSRKVPNIVSIGRTNAVKGWDLLIAAYAQVVADGTPCELILCGGGDPSELQQLAAALGVGSTVSFTGHLGHRDALELLRNCDLHVMPSRAETFGIASIEALALGKPIVMTPTDAAAAIVSDVNGVLAEDHSVESIRKSLEIAISRLDRYNASEIRAGCEARFSERVVTSRLADVYQEAVDEYAGSHSVRLSASRKLLSMGLRRIASWSLIPR